MKILANIFVGFIALQHVAFLVLEMFFWKKPLGQKIFPEQVSLSLRDFLQSLSDRRLLPLLHRLGQLYMVVARKPDQPTVNSFG